MIYTGCILFGSDKMRKLKSKVNRFFYRNRDKGIRNLMLVLAIGCGIVYITYLLNIQDPLIVNLLRFDRAEILHGQVWRLFTFPLLYLLETPPLLGFISLFFYVWAGSLLEQYWGTLKFNCFYLSGLLITDAAAMIFNTYESAGFLHMSLFLALATLMPDEQIRIWFIIPVKMKWLAWLDLLITLAGLVTGITDMIYSLSHGMGMYWGWVLPIVPLLNYFLYFGRQSANLLPDFLRYHPTWKSWKRSVKQKTVYPSMGGKANAGRGDNARFRCTVCGRTELTNPKLEFRYCSKCAGYRCYCADHIQNHVHITEDK